MGDTSLPPLHRISLLKGGAELSVEAFRLQNFMPFEDTGWIELKPICLLFGRNSSGKSAIIRALRLLKQSLRSESQDTPFVFVDEYGVDLDSFENVIHERDTNLPLSFSFRCTLEQNLDILHSRINEVRIRNSLLPIAPHEMPNIIEIELTYVTNKEGGSIWLQQVEIKVQLLGTTDSENDGSVLVFGAYYYPELANFGMEEWHFESYIFTEYSDSVTIFTGASVKTTSGFLPDLITPEISEVAQESYDDLKILYRVLSETNQNIRMFLESFSYVAPIRPKPQRTYALDSITRSRWERVGWNAMSYFLERGIDQVLIEELSEWVERFKLGTKVDLDTGVTLKSAVLSEIHIENSEGFTVNLVDTGYGVSQILPVIMECLFSKQSARNQLIVIEQPELHLHPRAQAHIADLLVAIATQSARLVEEHQALSESLPTKQEVETVKVRFLIETHSEYLLLRLRRRIAETSAGKLGKAKDRSKQINNNQVAIFFIDQMFGESIVQAVSLTRLGDFAYEPGGFRDFFANDIEEILALSKASREID